MNMTVFVWLVCAPVAVLQCVINCNETRFKKNLAVGVTFPLKGRADPEVQRLLQGFRRAQIVLCLGMLALAALCAALLGEGTVLLALCLWVDLLMAAQFVVYARYNGRLRAVKRERGWTVPNLRAASVTVPAAPVKRPSLWWFVAAAVAAAVPAAIDRELWYAYLLEAVMALGCWLGDRYLYRNRAETVDENDAVTAALTRVRRRAWDRVWVLCAWMMAAVSLGIWLSTALPSGGGAAMLLTVILALAVCAAAIALELRVRRVQEKLTASSGEGFYVDEDDKWLWGQVYYDPDDSRTIVNARTGVNTTVNLARPGGKAVAVLTLALLFVALPLLGVYVDMMSAAPLPLKIEDGALVAANFDTRYEMPLDEIAQAELLDALPAITARVWGVGMDSLLKGTFQTQWGRATLCLDPRTGPWLKVTMADGTLYLLGGGDAGAESVLAQIEQ